MSLSGGGFRAALFHLGVLWRLNELGLLAKLRRISSVSGGSITSALLAARWPHLRFDEDGVAVNFREEVAARVQDMCARTIDWPSFLIGWALPFTSPATVLAWQYRRLGLGRMTLADLPLGGAPEFVFCAASLNTGAEVRLSRSYIGHAPVGVFSNPTLPLATAVAASSAFPPFFAPLVVRLDPGGWRPKKGAWLFDREEFRREMLLVDGGARDNLGLEGIWEDYETVLVSDAGSPMAVDDDPWAVRHFNLSSALRTLFIALEQTQSIRKRWLIERFRLGVLSGTYWGISSDIADYGLETPMLVDSERTRSLQWVRTRLSRFSPCEQGRLINWGYAVADTAMRRWVIAPDPGPGEWPVPEHGLGPAPSPARVVAVRRGQRVRQKPRETAPPAAAGWYSLALALGGAAAAALLAYLLMS